MSSHHKLNPVYQQIIETLKSGIKQLDKTVCSEIGKFVGSKQHESGAFTDRGNSPDLYYSVFGGMLVKALEMKKSAKLLNQYVNNQDFSGLKPIDKYSLRFIKTLLNIQDEKHGKKIASFPSYRNRLFFLAMTKPLNPLKTFFLNKDRINLAYHLFMQTLVAGKKQNRFGFTNFIIRTGLKFYRLPANAPSSFLAAMIVADNAYRRKKSKYISRIDNYYTKGTGFKTFPQAEKSDMLSTATVLFSLKFADHDIRKYAPDALEFIQQNYHNGAFLSGDGDNTMDLEYTFYGLLALGSISNA